MQVELSCEDAEMLRELLRQRILELDKEINRTDSLAFKQQLQDRVPEEKLAWKPHAKSMSLGGLATHLANLPRWGGTILSESFFDLAASPPHLTEKTSRGEILAAFDETSKQAR